MDNKTPVSLLLEYLRKSGEQAEYNLIYGTEKHHTWFGYEVTARGISAFGKGKSKKEAKHNAAELLLSRLQRIQPLQEKCVSPLEDEFKKNVIGELQNFTEKFLKIYPKYDLIRDEGKPEAKIYGVLCSVLSFSTKAEARTKKQAKYKAAELMLSKLEEEFCNKSASKASGDIKQEAETTCEAFDRADYKGSNKDKKESSWDIFGKNLDIPIDKSAKHFLEALHKSKSLHSIAKCYKDRCFENLEDPEEVFRVIMVEINYDYIINILETISPASFVYYIEIKKLNGAVFMGLSTDHITNAKKTAIIKALTFLVSMFFIKFY